MCKSKIPSALLLFMLGSFLFSCQRGSGKGETKDYHLTVMDSILEQYNSQREEWDRSVLTKGSVSITVMDSMIAIEHDPENEGQLITYFLQTEKREGHIHTGIFGKAEVLFLERNVIVNSLEKDMTYLFSFNVDQDPYYLKSLKDVKQYKGIGLGVRKVNKDSPTKNAPYCSCVKAGSREDVCETGGNSALNCSSTNFDGSCRIICSGQRFACCGKKM